MADLDNVRAGWGGGQNLSSWEALMWRADGDHRTRSTGVVVEILETEPDWERLVDAHDRLSRRIPRLRERIIEPLLPLTTPVWSPDPRFDLDYHLQRVRLPGAGSDAELHTLAAQFAMKPLDTTRPPWEAMLVLGLRGGRAAYLFKPHHSLSDGIGLLQLLDLSHGHGPAPEPRPETAAPEPRPLRTSTGLLAKSLVSRAFNAPADAVRGAVDLAGRVLGDPVGVTTDAVQFAASLRRVLTPAQAPHSPALVGDGAGYRLHTMDVNLDELKKAGRAAGGSVNDAFLAGLLGGIRRYHETLGLEVDVLPMAIPVSLRTDADPLGANRFAGARFVAPVGEPDPAARIEIIHHFIGEARMEPALGFLDMLAPTLSVLPAKLLTVIAGELTSSSDIQASNLGAIPRPLYLAGARVTRVYPMGPRPGVGAMVTMVTYNGTCCIAVNFDPYAIADPDLFATCLRDGFVEVTALGH